MKIRSHQVSLASLCIGLLPLLSPAVSFAGNLSFGSGAHAAFESYRDNFGDTFYDFESLATGTQLTTQLAGATFASITDTSGNAATPKYVVVSGNHLNATYGNTIVGTPFFGGVDDGRVGYEIVFDVPQLRAGVLRTWNQYAQTSFFDVEGEQIGFHQNTTGIEFVGYEADPLDPNGWVKRIFLDGTTDPDPLPNSRQVGYTAEVFFGTTVIPEPSTYILFAAGSVMLLFFFRKKHKN